jgi:putative transcriptional regulator
MRKKKSVILEAVHETAKGLYKADVIDQKTWYQFDRLHRLSGELDTKDHDL